MKQDRGSVFRPRLRIYARAMIFIGTVLTAITAAVTWVKISEERRQLTEALYSRLADLSTGQALALSNSVWDLNRDNAKTIMQGLAQHPDFVAATVTDEKSRVFVALRAKDAMRLPVVSQTTDIVLKEQSSTKTIGSLELSLSLDRLRQAQEQALIDAIVLGFAQLFAVLVAVGLGLRTVVKPLTSITDTMVSVAAGHLDPPMPFVDRQDQVGAVARAVRSLRDMAVDHRKAKEALERAQSELEQRVEERTRELHASEKRFRDYAEASGDWFWETDADLRFTYMSGAVERILGVPPEWHYGMTREELLSKDHDKAAWAQHKKTLLERKPFRNFVYYRVGEGIKPHWLSINGIPVFDDSGTFIGYRGTGADITAQKRAELKLHASEEQLRQAQKMQAIGQLTGGVAHDFNNLLAVIRGNLEILAGKSGEKEPRVQAMFRAIGRGAELTQRLLAFSLRQSLSPRPIDLAGMVEEMSELLARTLGEGVTIETIAAEDLKPALADQGQVENALVNLAINARDAMSGSGKLTIECSNARLDQSYVARNPEVDAGDYVVLAVSDTGQGMTQKVLEHAVEPFFTTKKVGEGSGLGLSTVYGFAKQSGGHLAIYSEQGLGTTVKLYLPLADQAPQKPKVQPVAPEPSGRGELILIVEDDEEVRKVAASIVQSLGYEVMDVADASEALALLQQDLPIALVLSDVVLPGGMSGPEMADEARIKHPDLQFVFISGYPAEAARRNGSIGSDRVLLNKPFDQRALAVALRQALDK
ncbi:MAG: ATP-binding protein [Kiloniellales bacterium]|nr:ATP-binding protein [Kiloniellales bacterium]